MGMQGDASQGQQGERRPPWLPAMIGGALVAGLPALATFIGITFDLFPALRPPPPPTPVPPPLVRSVEIGKAIIAERRRPGGEVVFFVAEAVGYDTDEIVVATIWMDALTLRRAEPDMQVHARWTTFTRTDQVVGWLDVRYPPGRLPDGTSSSGCLFVRVFLYLPMDGEATPATDRLPFMLAYADTPPVDIRDVSGEACATLASSAGEPADA